MKNLIVGIDENTNVQELLSIGIKQFYFGYLPQNFIDKYDSKLSLNRRDNIKEQFINLHKIFDIIEKVQKSGAIIYLTLNHITSNQTMLDESKKIYEIFKDKVDGIIVSNITIATYLKNDGYSKIVTSNLFGCYSCQSIEFLISQFNPIKVILPRDMQLKDIEKIVNYFPNMKFECFLFGDGCKFSESFCFVYYGEDDLLKPTLCSYASTNNKIVKKANPSFKMIVKDGTLDETEKKESLQNKSSDVSSLIDELFILSGNFSSKDIVYVLNMLARLDIEEFYKTEITYTKAKSILKILRQFEKANILYEELRNKKFEACDSYKQYR